MALGTGTDFGELRTRGTQRTNRHLSLMSGTGDKGHPPKGGNVLCPLAVMADEH
jgi:hypothetical protein